MKVPRGELLKGMVLAASPNLADPNFHQTVVYIAECSANGALGLVMNRPLGKKLHEVVVSGEVPETLREMPVFQGGPVKPTGLLFARFQRGNSDEELRCEILGDPGGLIKSPGWVRAFAGYAGWGEGQVEAELAEHAWTVCPPHVAMLQEPVPPALWEAFVSEDQRWRKLQSLLPKKTDLN